MKNLEEQVRQYMKQYNMVEPGGRVIAAVSGGADSVCLLMLLHRLSFSMSFSLRAVHVHHGLRGAEADRDLGYVQELCCFIQVPFLAVYEKVEDYAKSQNLSTEEAGRILRYQALERAAKDWDAECFQEGASNQYPTRIAVAHQMADNAETILHNLLRGSGLKGISGIQPVSGMRIRPLLAVSRADIISWLKEQNIAWCEDSTNTSTDYTRNRIRHQLLPMMGELVNDGAMEHILQVATIAREADLYLSQNAEQLWQQEGKGDNQCAQISLVSFCAQPPIIQTYLIRKMLDCVAPGWKDISHGHFLQIQTLALRAAGSGSLDLPQGLKVAVDYTTLRIQKKQAEKEQECREDFEKKIKMDVFVREKAGEIPKNQYTKWFDYDKIKGTLSVRTRQEGDYINLPNGGRKKISRLMIDEKIPSGQRDFVPLVAEENHVLWVIGYRISEYYKVTDDTKTILQVTFDGGEE